MEFSLVGAGLILLLFNPVVLIHTYLWWCSFAGALFCLTLAAVVYESVLTALVRVVPEVVVYLADTRLDALLPLRVAMRIFLLSHELGFRAMAFASFAVMLFKSMTCTMLKRLSARSTLPLISIISCARSVFEQDLWKLAASLEPGRRHVGSSYLGSSHGLNVSTRCGST